MSFCPNCRTEFRSGFYKCSDCGSPLEASLSPIQEEGHQAEDELVMVYDPPDTMMCLSIAALLEENGISYAIKSGSDQIWLYDGAAGAMRHRLGKVLVLDGDRKRAEELINGYLSAPVPEDPETSGGPGQTDETTEPEDTGEEK